MEAYELADGEERNVPSTTDELGELEDELNELEKNGDYEELIEKFARWKGGVDTETLEHQYDLLEDEAQEYLEELEDEGVIQRLD